MWPRDTLWHPYVTLSLEICHVTLFLKEPWYFCIFCLEKAHLPDKLCYINYYVLGWSMVWLGRALRRPRVEHSKRQLKWSSSAFGFLLWGTIKCLLNGWWPWRQEVYHARRHPHNLRPPYSHPNTPSYTHTPGMVTRLTTFILPTPSGLNLIYS